MKLNKTQQELLARAQRWGGVVAFSTSLQRKGRFNCYVQNGRELRAAEKLVGMGLLVRGKTIPQQTSVRYSMGYRTERWTDHLYKLPNN